MSAADLPSPFFATVTSYVSRYAASLKSSLSTTLTVVGWQALLTKATQDFMEYVAKFNVDGSQKKEMVILAAEQLFDQLSPYIKIPYVSAWMPSFVRNYVLKQMRAAIRPLLTAFIEQLFAILETKLKVASP